MRLKMTTKTRGACLISALSIASSAFAQVENGGFATVIDVPPTVIGNSVNLGPNTQVNIRNGGVVGTNFRINFGSNHVEINISGGTVGRGFRNFSSSPGTVVNISGGTIGRDMDFTAGAVLNISGGFIGGSSFFQDSTLNITGGTIDDVFHVTNGSVANMSGGNVVKNLTIQGPTTVFNLLKGGVVGSSPSVRAGTLNVDGGTLGSVLTMTEGGRLNVISGSIGNSTFVRTGSVLTITGGTMGKTNGIYDNSTINIFGGTVDDRDFDAFDTSTVNLHGSSFILDGVLLDLAIGESMVITDRNVTLVAVLPNGTLFEYDLFSTNSGPLNDSLAPSATLNVTRVEPDAQPCPADLTGDGELNFFDVSAFLSAFAAGEAVADFSEDGEFNFFDVSLFLQAFSGGCP